MNEILKTKMHIHGNNVPTIIHQRSRSIQFPYSQITEWAR